MIYLYFWRIFLLAVEFQVGCVFLHKLKILYHCFQMCFYSPDVKSIVILFSSVCFVIFWSSAGLLWCVLVWFLFVSSTWGLFIFLDLWTYSFHYIWKVLFIIYSNNFLHPFPSCGTLVAHVSHDDIVPESLRSYFLKNYFFFFLCVL